MTAITASMVKELRTKTGAGMMDCKKALAEHNGNMEEAMDWLRKKGFAAAEKKSGRTAAEGLVAVSTQGNKGSCVEVNAETDFVARNDQFQAYARTTADVALSHGDSIENLQSASYPNSGKTVEAELKDLIATIGENMVLRRTAHMEVSHGVVASYIHNAVASNLGKIGVLVALESSADEATLQELGKQIAMHIAATAPQAATVDELDPAVVQKEKDFLVEQAKTSGKPAEFIDKIIEGRMRKFYEENVLVEQAFVINPDMRVKDVIAEASKNAGTAITLKGYTRFALGEGIEREETDFAAEVAAQLGQ